MRWKLNQKNIDYLNQDSLFGDLMHSTFKTLSIIFTSSFCLLILFKPYILCQMTFVPRLILIVGYSTIACVSFVLSFLIFSPYAKKKWTKLLVISMYVTCFVLAWLQIYGYTILNIKSLFPVYGISYTAALPDYLFVNLLFYTFGIGVILYLVIHAYGIIISLERLSDNDSSINELKMDEKLRPTYDSNISICGKNKNEVLEIDIQHFIFAKSEGHYIKIFYMSDDSNDCQLCVMRNTISDVEKQLMQFDSICRCHKSYIINVDYLKTIIGNSAKAYVYIKNIPDKIPVSPQKFRNLKSKIEIQ